MATVEALGLAHPPSRNDPVEHAAYLVELGGVRILHLGDAAPASGDIERVLKGRGAPDLLPAPYWVFTRDERREMLAAVGASRAAAFHLPREAGPERQRLHSRFGASLVPLVEAGQKLLTRAGGRS